MKNTIIALATVFLAAIASPSALNAQAPQPITSKSGLGVETFVGWQKVTSGLPAGVKYMHRPKTAKHKGSAAWFYDHPTADLRAALIASAKSGGITNVKILGDYPLKRVTLLDRGSSGRSFIADGMRLSLIHI